MRQSRNYEHGIILKVKELLLNVLDKYKGIMLKKENFHNFRDMYTSLYSALHSPNIFLALKSSSSEIIIATPIFFWLVLVWYCFLSLGGFKFLAYIFFFSLEFSQFFYFLTSVLEVFIDLNFNFSAYIIFYSIFFSYWSP